MTRTLINTTTHHLITKYPTPANTVIHKQTDSTNNETGNCNCLTQAEN
jgi:hypothetical protein